MKMLSKTRKAYFLRKNKDTFRKDFLDQYVSPVLHLSFQKSHTMWVAMARFDIISTALGITFSQILPHKTLINSEAIVFHENEGFDGTGHVQILIFKLLDFGFRTYLLARFRHESASFRLETFRKC